MEVIKRDDLTGKLVQMLESGDMAINNYEKLMDFSRDNCFEVNNDG